MNNVRFQQLGSTNYLQNLGKVKESLNENGVVLLESFLSEDLVSRIRDEWDQVHQVKNLESSTTKKEPLVVFWRHVKGERKKTRPISEFPSIKELAFDQKLSELIKTVSGSQEIRLLETIIFNKPPQVSNNLNWHQDVAYFPFEPNNQIAVWIPLDPVDIDNGTLQYVLKSHKKGSKGSVDLHTGEAFENEDRPLIPKDPIAAGYDIFVADAKPGDMTIHHGYTWHCSGPNVTHNRDRRGLSLRFMVGETKYKPRFGSAASFIGQVEVQPGDVIEGPAFPLI